MALLQAYGEAIPHSEEGLFQIQRPSQQYFYRYLDDARPHVASERLDHTTRARLVVKSKRQDWLCGQDVLRTLVPKVGLERSRATY